MNGIHSRRPFTTLCYASRSWMNCEAQQAQKSLFGTWWDNRTNLVKWFFFSIGISNVTSVATTARALRVKWRDNICCNLCHLLNHRSTSICEIVEHLLPSPSFPSSYLCLWIEWKRVRWQEMHHHNHSKKQLIFSLAFELKYYKNSLKSNLFLSSSNWPCHFPHRMTWVTLLYTSEQNVKCRLVFLNFHYCVKSQVVSFNAFMSSHKTDCSPNAIEAAAAAPELLFKDRDLSSFVKGWSHLHFPSVLSYAWELLPPQGWHGNFFCSFLIAQWSLRAKDISS